jgi:hypothetical protein
MHWNHHLFATARIESLEGADEPARIKQLILTVSPRLVASMKDLHSRPHPGLNRCDFVTEEFLSFRQLLYSIAPSFFAEEKRVESGSDWELISQTADPSMSPREVDAARFDFNF